MSNKLKKKIKCCLCNRTVPYYTEGCQKLFDKDVCPECVVKVAAIVNEIIDEPCESILEVDDTKELPDHVAIEPEYIVGADGSIKFTGFGLVRK